MTATLALTVLRDLTREKEIAALWQKISADKRLYESDRTVAAALLKRLLEAGDCNFHRMDLAALTRLHHHTVTNSAARLARLGYVYRVGNKRFKSGGLWPNLPILPETDMKMIDQQHADHGYVMTPSDKFDSSKTVGFDGAGVFVAACGKCGSEVQVGHSRDRRMPPEVVVQMFRKKGWHVHLRKAKLNLCDKCLNPPKQVIRTESKVMPQPVPLHAAPVIVAVPPPAAAPVQPRALTAIELRKVNSLLEAKFDDERGRYEKDWDDEAVAIECNVPRASVIRYREDAFGRLKTFEDIEQVLKDIAALKAMAEDLEKQVVLIRNKRLA